MLENIALLISALFGVLFLLVIVGSFFANSIGIVVALVDYFFGDRLHFLFLKKPLEQKYRLVVTEKFPYHRKLSEQQKLLFEKKMQRYIDQTEFVAGHDITHVSDEMVALISATAVQITFGFQRIYLKHFTRVFVYADVYQSRATGNWHQGEVNSKGAIVLSWRSFVDGIANETDGRNLGLHEMAHAIRVENAVTNKEYNFIDYDSLVKFTAEGRREMQKMDNGEASFFRGYGSTNDQEFFAVAVENFFERPAEFHGHSPTLYKLMSVMLRQDPMKMVSGAL